VFIKVKTPCFLNKVNLVFNEGGSFPTKRFQFVGKKPSEGVSGSTYSAYNRFKGGVFFVNFRFLVDSRGLRIMGNKSFLSVGVQGRGFYGFGDEASNVVQRVFAERFVGGRRKEVKEFGFVVSSIHNNCGISFIRF
jgi:hypothetical protein